MLTEKKERKCELFAHIKLDNKFLWKINETHLLQLDHFFYRNLTQKTVK